MNCFVSSALDLIVIGLGIFLCGGSIEESALGRASVTRARAVFDAAESQRKCGGLAASAEIFVHESSMWVYGF